MKGSKPSYNFCRICGRRPGEGEEPNNGPLRWWDPDDGWIIGTICRWCWEEFGDAKPKPEDFAYRFSNGVCDDEDTDEDITPVLSDLILEACESSPEELAEYEDAAVDWDAYWGMFW